MLKPYMLSFRKEDERLKTFASFPIDWLDKKELAMTGMYFLNDGNKTKCYFCEVEIDYWERDDQPITKHLRWSPNCPLLRRRTTNNVPINCEALDRLLPPLSYICDLNEHSEYPEYAIETVRLRTFSNWPRNMKQKPMDLAEAGFFYTGVGDRVKCFSCGGGLKDWDDNDEPWEQHALWMSKCHYLKLVKGNTYIETVQMRCKKSFEEKKSQNSSATTTPNNTNVNAEVLKKPTANVNLTANNSSSSITMTTSCAGGIIDEEQNQKPSSSSAIPEEKLCKICYTNEYNIVFLTCGHVVACDKCASSLTKCPMCRKPFTNVMRLYFS